MKGILFLLFIGILEFGSACLCNDGNNKAGDGCFNCVIEDGWRCPPAEVEGDCECLCIKGNQTCGCSWMSTGKKIPKTNPKSIGSGGPVSQALDLDRVGARLRSPAIVLVQGFTFQKSGCNEDNFWSQQQTLPPCENGLVNGLTLQFAQASTEGLDWNDEYGKISTHLSLFPEI